MNNNDRLIYLGGKMMPVSEATINVLAPTSQFGANVFEGIRCYWNENKKQLYAFKLKEHYQRMKNSIKMIRFEDKYSVEEMKQGLIDVVRANKYKEDIAVRQTIFLDGFGNWAATGPVNMFIAPIPKGRSYENKPGIRCCVSSWERINDRNISPRVKVGANYINSRNAQIEAVTNGYDSAIFMNNTGKIAEGPGSCLFIVRDNTLITPPVTASVLESITRSTVMELAMKELKIKTEIRDIDRTELYICDEVFLCGSAMEIVSVINVDGLPVGNGGAGAVASELQKLYLQVVRGEKEEYMHWLTPIY